MTLRWVQLVASMSHRAGVLDAQTAPSVPPAKRVAIVTGAAGGIGLRCCRRLATDRMVGTVFLFDMAPPALEKAVASLADAAAATGVAFRSQPCDVTSEASVTAAVGAVLAAAGRVDILIQCAGITGKTGIKTHEVDAANFEQVFAVNSRGVFLCAKAVLPSMLKQKYGRIVNVASISGKEGNAGMLAYSASKAAVICLTKVMGKDYATADGSVTINAVAPAVVRTAMVAAMPAAQVKYMTDKIPMARCGTEDEVASTILFAASDAASFTTGFTYDATGGRTVY